MLAAAPYVCVIVSCVTVILLGQKWGLGVSALLGGVAAGYTAAIAFLVIYRLF